MGATIFNAIYELALVEVRQQVEQAGIVSKLHFESGCVFARVVDMPHLGPDAPVYEVTYVDDEAAALLASSPMELDSAIEIMLRVLATVFHRYGLSINWEKAKSEALLVYRGGNSARHLDARGG